MILIGGALIFACWLQMSAESSPYNIRQSLSAMTKEERLVHEAEWSKSFFRLQPTRVNPFLQNYVVTPRDICDENTYILIVIHTYHVHTERRWAIRKTWGSISKGGQWPHHKIHDSIRLAFILGIHHDDFLNGQILEEADTHNDIIQGDFAESLSNSTLKSLQGMRFFIQHCPHAKFYMKAEDDIFLHVPNLLDRLHHTQMHRAVMGQFIHHDIVQRVGSEMVPIEDYPFKYYTSHENKAGYIIDGPLVGELFNASEYVHPIQFENIYITGILGRILNVTHIIPEESPFVQILPRVLCLIIEKLTVIVHRITLANMVNVWDELLNAKSCPKRRVKMLK